MCEIYNISVIIDETKMKNKWELISSKYKDIKNKRLVDTSSYV